MLSSSDRLVGLFKCLVCRVGSGFRVGHGLIGTVFVGLGLGERVFCILQVLVFLGCLDGLVALRVTGCIQVCLCLVYSRLRILDRLLGVLLLLLGVCELACGGGLGILGVRQGGVGLGGLGVGFRLGLLGSLVGGVCVDLGLIGGCDGIGGHTTSIGCCLLRGVLGVLGCLLVLGCLRRGVRLVLRVSVRLTGSSCRVFEGLVGGILIGLCLIGGICGLLRGVLGVGIGLLGLLDGLVLSHSLRCAVGTGLVLRGRRVGRRGGRGLIGKSGLPRETRDCDCRRDASRRDTGSFGAFHACPPETGEPHVATLRGMRLQIGVDAW